MISKCVFCFCPHRCKITYGRAAREREVPAERPAVVFWERKTWHHPVWPLTPILTATYPGSWVCLHLQAILIITITRPTTQALTGYTRSMASQEAWGPIPLSPDQSLNTSPRAWWPCAWKPKTPGACYPGRRDRAAAIAMTSLSQQTVSMPAQTGMLVLLRNTQLKDSFFNAQCTRLFFAGFQMFSLQCPGSVSLWKHLICLCVCWNSMSHNGLCTQRALM